MSESREAAEVIAEIRKPSRTKEYERKQYSRNKIDEKALEDDLRVREVWDET
tara:strand:+ start:6385 stop:6540 length:156 start_codon:yes stop_codon:yes gene_type:complete